MVSSVAEILSLTVCGIGRKVYVRIGAICCDRPAAVAITGVSHFSKEDTPCLKCTVPRNRMHLPGQFPLRSGLEHSHAMLNQQREFLAKFDEAPQTSYQTHVARRAGRITKASQAHVERLENAVFQVPGHLSIFDLFPNLDKLTHSVVDPMHAILEGVLPYYIRRVLILGRFCGMPPSNWRQEEDDDVVSVHYSDGEGEGGNLDELRDMHERIMERNASSENPRQVATYERVARAVLGREEADGKPVIPKKLLPRIEWMMEQVVLPPYIDSIGKGFFTKQKKPTAAQWRTFGEILGPLVMPWLWAEEAVKGSPLPAEELTAILKLFAIVRYTFQSAISEAQITRLREHIDNFSRLVAKLHPYLPARVTNFHIIRHIPDDIVNHGPIYGWWLMALERLNGRIKRISLSGRNMFQEQVIALRALLRGRSAFLHLNKVFLSEAAVNNEAYLEEVLDGFKQGGIDLRVDDELETLRLFDNSGLDQQFSIDLLSRGRRTQATEDKDVFRHFLTFIRYPFSESIINRYEFHHELAVRGYSFRPIDPEFKWSWAIDAAAELPGLLCKKNARSFLECRPAIRRFAEVHEQTMTGILWCVFSHTRRTRDGAILSEKLYGVFRWLKWRPLGQNKGYEYIQEWVAYLCRVLRRPNLKFGI